MNMSIFTSVITLTDETMTSRHVLISTAENIISAREFIENKFPGVPCEGLTEITAQCGIRTNEEKVIGIKSLKE